MCVYICYLVLTLTSNKFFNFSFLLSIHILLFFFSLSPLLFLLTLLPIAGYEIILNTINGHDASLNKHSDVENKPYLLVKRGFL